MVVDRLAAQVGAVKRAVLTALSAVVGGGAFAIGQQDVRVVVANEMGSTGVVGGRKDVVEPVTGLVHDHGVRPAVGVGGVGTDVDALLRVVGAATGIPGRSGQRLPGVGQRLRRCGKRAVDVGARDPFEHVHP